MPFAKLLVLISYAHPALRVNGLASPGAVRQARKLCRARIRFWVFVYIYIYISMYVYYIYTYKYNIL